MGNSAVAPRSHVSEQLPYFRATVNFDTPLIGTMRWVPLGPGISVAAAF